MIGKVLSRVLQNKYITFTAIRYVSYFILFVRGFFMAQILGPFYLGVFGVLSLMFQYLCFSSLGIEYALNTKLSLMDNRRSVRSQLLVNTSFTISLIISILLFLIFVMYYFFLKQDDFIKLKQPSLYILIIIGLVSVQNSQQLFANIYRIENQFILIGITELITAIGTTLVVLLFSGEQLIYYFYLVWLVALIFNNLIFFIFYPNKLQITFKSQTVKELLHIGLPLLAYNFSFYLIMLSCRTIVGVFYKLEVLGYYTLAYNITSAIMLGLNSIAWMIYPKVLSKVKEGVSQDQVILILRKLNNIYSFAVFVIVLVFISLSPIVFIFLPKYVALAPTLILLLITQGILSTNFGFISLAVSREKYYAVALMSLIGSSISIVLSLLFASNNFPFYWIAVSSFIGSLAFVILSFKYSMRIINSKEIKFIETIPVSIVAPLITCLIGSFLPYPFIYYISAMILFTLFNLKRFAFLLNFIKSNI